MNYTDIISNYGFPIFCVIVMGIYINNQQKIFREELKALREEHKEEVDKLDDTVQNNTLIIQRFVDLFDSKLVDLLNRKE